MLQTSKTKVEFCFGMDSAIVFVIPFMLQRTLSNELDSLSYI